MSIRVDNTAQTYPGLLCWLLLVGVFLATGEWVDSVARAQHHPVLLVVVAAATILSSILFARGLDRSWAIAFPVSLLATFLFSGFIVVLILLAAKIRIFEFTLLRRSFGLGLAVLVGLTLLYLLAIIISPVFALVVSTPERRRDRAEKQQQASLSAAIEELRNAVRVRPDDAAIHLELGRTLMQKRKLDATIMPAAPRGFMNPRYRQMLKDELEVAAGTLRDAVRLAPENPDAHGELGEALRQQGNCQDAILELQKAIQLKPDYTVAHVSLALALEQKQDWKGAIAEYREAVGLQPDAPKLHLLLGKALGHTGDWEGALAELRKAHELEPMNAEFRYEYERLRKMKTSLSP